MYQILKIEYETMKDKAKINLVAQQMEQQRQQSEEKEKVLEQKENLFQLSKAIHQRYHDDLIKLQLRENEF